jgi:hypothetical protein
MGRVISRPTSTPPFRWTSRRRDDIAVEALVALDGLDEAGRHAAHVLYGLAQLVDRDIVVDGHGTHIHVPASVQLQEICPLPEPAWQEAPIEHEPDGGHGVELLEQCSAPPKTTVRRKATNVLRMATG